MPQPLQSIKWFLPTQRFTLALAVTVLTAVAPSNPVVLSSRLAAAEPLSQRDQWVQRLQEPHTGLVDGMTLRVAILTVAQSQTQPARHINTWIDRKVNPDLAVYPGGLGPTRYASLCKIAESAGCVCYPVDNCILIGRPAWVAELSRTVFLESDSSRVRSPSNAPHRAAVDLDWPNLTTPSEAIQIARGHSGGRPDDGLAGETLPHDLWPATMLRDISPQLAEQLIRGQFTDGTEIDRLAIPFTRSYRFAGTKDAIDSLRDIDPNLKTNTSGGQVRLLATAAAHQRFCVEILSKPDQKSQLANMNPVKGDALERLQSNERTFIFQASNDPAGKLIKGLTAQIGIECEFDAEANQQLSKLVTIKAVDQTVWQLVRLIAEKASLKIQASGDKLRISAKD
ncbi:MAG: hypothetical protein KDB00_09525 [Planctomycetales bacterium]|nr:hypothetical protein [Planctomycetales bacterium]